MRVGKVTDDSPSHFVRRNGENVGYVNLQTVEEWKNKLHIPRDSSGVHSLGVNQYGLIYVASSSEDDTVGSYKLTYKAIMYSPNEGDIYHDLQVQINMSMLSNGYLEYNVDGIELDAVFIR